MTGDRIFSSRRGAAPELQALIAVAFAVAILLACALEGGGGTGLVLAFGVPAVVFGPGSIDNAHAIDEFVPSADLVTAAAFYREVALRFGRK